MNDGRAPKKKERELPPPKNGDLAQLQGALPPEIQKIISRLHGEDRRHFLAFIQFSVTSVFRGPLPPPEELAKYESTLPGSADRILKMAEAQNTHRISLESTILPKQQRESSRGQWFALIIGLTGLGGAVWLGLAGHDWLAGTIASVDFVGLATTFILGRKKQSQDLANKRN